MSMSISPSTGLSIQVDYRWEDLRRCFVALDPHKTGCVSESEFQDIVTEICVHVGVRDLELIMSKHGVNDHRYVCFFPNT